MKKIKLFLLLLFVMFPTFVNATDKFTIVSGDNAALEENVNGSSILAGNNVVSTNNTDGINMLFGNSVKYEGVSDYALIAGNIVEVSGNIENDGFIFGNIVSFNENFSANRDLFVFASEVELKGVINRDITIYASSVILDDVEILGNVTIYSTNLEVKDSSIINGVLSYNEDNNAVISNIAKINETKLLEKLVQESKVTDKIYNFFIDYAGMLLIFLVLAIVFPSLFRKIETISEDFKFSKIFTLFGFGAMLLISVPMLIVLLFTTVIGVSLGLLTLVLYIIVVWLSIMLTGYLLGNIVWNKFIKKENNILLIGLIGISIIYVLQLIPVIGEFITIFSLMIGLGVVLQLFKRK